MDSRRSNSCDENEILSGVIIHTDLISDRIGTLYLNDTYSDLTLIIENEKISAHKLILATCGEYFRALLFGGMRESSQDEIVISETNAEVFKILLKYIYTGIISLRNMKENLILEVLGLAHKYGFLYLEVAICDYLKRILNRQNSCIIYDVARLYNFTFLMQVSASFIDHDVEQILLQDSFLQLSLESLKCLISSDSFFAPEIDIFKAVCRWIETNSGISPENQLKILNTVRLSLTSIEELVTVVRPTGLISDDRILDAIEILTSKESHNKINYRGLRYLERIVTSPKLGANVVLRGESRTCTLLDENVPSYDLSTGYVTHLLSEKFGILIKLGTRYVVNHIKMLLWDKDDRSYSYYIEVSTDQKEWTRVVDHSEYLCRSWQYLYFTSRVVEYARIVGTKNTKNEAFHVVHFEMMYTNTSYTIEKGLIVPEHNVAICGLGANVIEGKNHIKNSLLDGNISVYDGETGYTSHTLGAGCILVQLGQPYMIDSIRFLLWDRDNRVYSYYVEVSINKCDWIRIADKTGERCSSWQTLRFDSQPVVFIRITGTQNTANNGFHIVHFECPVEVEVASMIS